MTKEFRGVLDVEKSLHTMPSGYSIEPAYLLWYCLGYIGAHNFYLKRFFHGLINSTLFTVGFLTIPLKFGVIPLSILAILLIIDFLRIPKIVKRKNIELIRSGSPLKAS